MTPETVLRCALEEQFRADIASWRAGEFTDAALDSVARGHYRLISTNGKTLYLARIWLTPPRRVDGPEVFASDNSTLLHRIMEPDDARAFHDHPWAFKSRVLAGGYTEERPECDPLVRRVGSEVFRGAGDLHRVAAVAPGTWTLVETGARVRRWGFWMPHGDYLAAMGPKP